MRPPLRPLPIAFGAFGVVWGAWQAVLPDLASRFELTTGPLGLMLTAGFAVSLPVMLGTGRLVDRVGPGRGIAITGLAMARRARRRRHAGVAAGARHRRHPLRRRQRRLRRRDQRRRTGRRALGAADAPHPAARRLQRGRRGGSGRRWSAGRRRCLVPAGLPDPRRHDGRRLGALARLRLAEPSRGGRCPARDRAGHAAAGRAGRPRLPCRGFDGDVVRHLPARRPGRGRIRRGAWTRSIPRGDAGGAPDRRRSCGVTRRAGHAARSAAR